MVFANKEDFNEYRNDWVRKRRRRFDVLKTVPCTDCGAIYPPYIMQWDHLPEFEKSFTIGSNWQYSEARILDEIAKCELVCANCHAERTHNRATVSQLAEETVLETV